MCKAPPLKDRLAVHFDIALHGNAHLLEFVGGRNSNSRLSVNGAAACITRASKASAR